MGTMLAANVSHLNCASATIAFNRGGRQVLDGAVKQILFECELPAEGSRVR